MNWKYSAVMVGVILTTACSNENSNDTGKDAAEVFTGPDFTPEVAGIWEGTTTDSVTETTAEAFLFTNDDGRLILASREAISAEGSALLDNRRMKGDVTATTPEGHTFIDASDTAQCEFNAVFRTQMNINGTYACPDGTTGSFAVTRISPLASEMAAEEAP